LQTSSEIIQWTRTRRRALSFELSIEALYDHTAQHHRMAARSRSQSTLACIALASLTLCLFGMAALKNRGGKAMKFLLDIRCRSILRFLCALRYQDFQWMMRGHVLR
jgi:hypothetical protein